MKHDIAVIEFIIALNKDDNAAAPPLKPIFLWHPSIQVGEKFNSGLFTPFKKSSVYLKVDRQINGIHLSCHGCDHNSLNLEDVGITIGLVNFHTNKYRSIRIDPANPTKLKLINTQSERDRELLHDDRAFALRVFDAGSDKLASTKLQEALKRKAEQSTHGIAAKREKRGLLY